MKIKYSIISKLNTLTDKEMDLFFFIVRRENQSTGTAEGIHYREVVQVTGMSKASFYNAISGLEKKQIVKVSRSSTVDYDVRVLDNEFPTTSDYRAYVNLNREAFRSKAFQKLKAHEKYMLLEFLKGTHQNGHSLREGVGHLYEKFMRILNVKWRTIQGYLFHLKQFFTICKKKGMFYITYRHSVFKKIEHEKSEEKMFIEHQVRKECRRCHASYTEHDIEKTAEIVPQYRQIVGGNIPMLDILMCGIRKSVEEISYQKRKLSGAWVHKIVKDLVKS